MSLSKFSDGPAVQRGGTGVDGDDLSRDAQLQLSSLLSNVAPDYDLHTFQPITLPPQTTWWDADGSLDLVGHAGDTSTLGLTPWLDNGQHNPTSWALASDQFYLQGDYLPHTQGEDQTALFPYLARRADQTGYGHFPTIDSSPSILEHPPTTGHIPVVTARPSSEPEIDRTVTGEGSNRAPTNADGASLLSPVANNGSQTSEAGDTVKRLVALVKEQQNTIELLLQKVKGRPRRKPKTADSRPIGRANVAQGPPVSTPSASGAIVKARAKRGALGPIARADTAETREVAACIRCQRVRKRCRMGANSSQPCLDCIAVNPASLRIPCIRSRVTDSILFRTTTSEKDTWTVRPEVYKLSDLATNIPSPLKMLELTHDLGNTLCVYVKEFTPVVGDTTSYTHVLKDGSVLELEMPCYAIAQLVDTQTALSNYVDKSLVAYLEYHFDDSDYLIWETFQLAIKRACWQDSQLLKKTLRLWMASRLTERPWRICGEETLGMTTIDDPRSPFCGRIPVPPIMDTQLDQVVIQSILGPLRQQVLKLLNERISKKNRKDWFEIYATIFILLNNLEVATAHDHEFASRFGHYTAGRGNRFEDYRLVEGYFHSAQALIAHFRDALHGQRPFTMDWTSSDLTSVIEVNAEEARYLQMLKQHLNKRKTTYSLLKAEHRYESMLYWGHQLFSDTWDPSQVQIKELE